MSEIRGAWVPEDPAEDALLMDLHEATRTAYNEGVETDDIVAGMLYLAAAIALHGDDSDVVEAAEEADVGQRDDCPECGGQLDSVLVQLGGPAEARPCGCTVDVDDVPGYVETGGDR